MVYSPIVSLKIKKLPSRPVRKVLSAGESIQYWFAIGHGRIKGVSLMLLQIIRKRQPKQ